MLIHTIIFVYFIWRIEGLQLSPEYKDIYFGTKTSYRKISNINGANTKIHIPHDYTVEMVYLLTRHGARYPGGSTYKHIVELKNILTKANHPLSKLLDPNKFMIHGMDNELANAGFMDQFRLGRTIGNIFSKYLLQSIRGGSRVSEHLHFRSTCKRRTIHSMEAFKNGFFHNLLGKELVNTKSCSDGNVLRFYDYCRAFKSHRQQIHTLLHQFHDQKLFQEMSIRIHKKLNIRSTVYRNDSISSSSNLKLSFDQIHTLYSICSFRVLLFDVSINQDSFCRLFDNTDFALWEYYNDAADDHKIGHAYKSNSIMSTPLFHHIFNLLHDTVGNNNPNNFNFYAEFAHAETLLPLFGLLNIIPDYINQLKYRNIKYVDIPMDVNGIKNSLEYTRIRRYGKILPMNANIMFIVLKNNRTNKKGIALYVNEILTPMECCVKKSTLLNNPQENKICPWEIFKSCYEHLSNENQLFNQYCGNN